MINPKNLIFNNIIIGLINIKMKLMYLELLIIHYDFK